MLTFALSLRTERTYLLCTILSLFVRPKRVVSLVLHCQSSQSKCDAVITTAKAKTE